MSWLVVDTGCVVVVGGCVVVEDGCVVDEDGCVVDEGWVVETTEVVVVPVVSSSQLFDIRLFTVTVSSSVPKEMMIFAVFE